jgi:ATP-dependent RNA helicase SUPV3L1/SUV3
MATWLEQALRRRLKPLYRLLEAELGSAVRGLAFQLAEGLGSMPRRPAATQIRAMTRADRQALARHGVRIGLESVYLSALLKPQALRLRATLWAVRHGGTPPLLPGKDGGTLPAAEAPADFWAAIGYRPLGPRAIRADRLETLARALRKLASQGEFAETEDLRTLTGCEGPDFEAVLGALGYRSRPGENGVVFRLPKKPAGQKGRRRGRKPKPNADSPFADLKKLVSGK